MNDEWFKILKKINNDAAWHRQRDSIERMLKQGVDVNCCNKQGQNALDIMIRKETPSIEFLQVLLAAGIELQSPRELLEHVTERLSLSVFDMFDSPSVNHAKTASQHVYLMLWQALERDAAANNRDLQREQTAQEYIDKFSHRLDEQRDVARISAQLSDFHRTRFTARECAVKTPWQSKFGGIPYLPKDASLPACFDDDTLKFAFQLNLEEIKDTGAPTPLPNNGLLQVFLYRYDPDEDSYPDERVEVLYWPELPIEAQHWTPFPALTMNCDDTFHRGETGIEWLPAQVAPNVSEQPQAVDEAIFNLIPSAREDEALLIHWRDLYANYTQMAPWSMLGRFDEYELSEFGSDCEGYLPLLKKMQLEHGTCHFMIPADALAKADFSQLKLKRIWE